MRLEAAADFADLFEVKDALAKRGESYAEVRGEELVLGYRREQFVRLFDTHPTDPRAAPIAIAWASRHVRR